MASSKEYLDFILEQLSGLEEISYRQMMGEFIIYYKGKIAGGIYDDRFLVKPVESARRLMPDAGFEVPYEGAKEMLLVDNVDSREFLTELFETIYDELPAPKSKKFKTCGSCGELSTCGKVKMIIGNNKEALKNLKG